MSRWFRHYAGMMRDDKLVRVAIRTKQPIERVVWVFGAILESAAEVDHDGTYDVDAEEIAYFLRANQADIQAIFSGLESAGHIASGAVVKWSDRQFKSDKSADRQAAYRERKRRAGDDSRQGQEQETDSVVTSLSRHADAPETELETETELKTEAKASSKSIGSRLPDDWESRTLGSDTIAGQIIAARGHAWATRALESFRNHWRSANGPNARKRDWQAAWANWIIEQDNRDGRRTNGMGRHQPASDGLSSTARASLAVFGR